MNSLILKATTRFLHPLLLLFSIFLLLKGHNEPGGGFAGGLVAAAGFALHAIAFDVTSARRMLLFDPIKIIGVGLFCALGSGIWSMVNQQTFMTGLWYKLPVWGLGTIDLGTPLLFDVGVYLVVIGVTLTLIFSMAEE